MFTWRSPDIHLTIIWPSPDPYLTLIFRSKKVVWWWWLVGQPITNPISQGPLYKTIETFVSLLTWEMTLSLTIPVCEPPSSTQHKIRLEGLWFSRRLVVAMKTFFQFHIFILITLCWSQQDLPCPKESSCTPRGSCVFYNSKIQKLRTLTKGSNEFRFDEP